MSKREELNAVLTGYFIRKAEILSQDQYENQRDQELYERGLNDAEKCIVKSVKEAQDVSH